LSIIFQKGDEFWIESIVVPVLSITALEIVTTTIQLSKPGDYLAAQVCYTSSSENITRFLSAYIRKTNGGSITFGENLTAIELVRGNEHSANINVGANILIFMRGSKN